MIKVIKQQNIVDQPEHRIVAGQRITFTAEYMPIIQEACAEDESKDFYTGFYWLA